MSAHTKQSTLWWVGGLAEDEYISQSKRERDELNYIYQLIY